MGSKLSLTENFIGAGLTNPVLYADRILSPGSLILVDGGHSAGGFGAGVPADLASLPNVAWEQAAAIIGAGNATTLACGLDRSDGVGIAWERSAKGGLHGIVKQDGSLAASVGGKITMPAAIKTYLRANPNHDYYFGVWDRITRTANVGGSGTWSVTGAIMNTSSATGNALAYFITGGVGDGVIPLAGAKRGGRRIDPAINAEGPTYRSLGTLEWTGAAPANDAALRDHLALWGAVEAYANSLIAGTNAAPSWVLYRLYVEDLTVSGRTWAEVDTLDHALWAEAFGVGGRFAGDTFTDPDTV
jgi:hypothetical protein